MLIGVVSDTHNNIRNIEKIVSLFNEKEISLVVHTGDIASAKSLEKFSCLNGKLIGVFGNNDRNETGFEEVSKKYSFDFGQPPRCIKVLDKNIAIFHEPEKIEDYLVENSNIDIILHGHTHRYRNELYNEKLIFNPGESAGFFKGKNAIGIVDTQNLRARRIFF